MFSFFKNFVLAMIVCQSVMAQDNNSSFDYFLGSGDLIKIYVYDEDDLTMEVRLGNDGIISYPFIGEISAQGMSIRDVEKVIYDGLKGDYLKHPRVSVSVVEYRKFFIDGEVSNPGGYAFEPGLTVQKAIALAGGFTERASKSKIFLKRKTQAEGKKSRLKVPLNYVMKPEDVLIVEQSFF